MTWLDTGSMDAIRIRALTSTAPCLIRIFGTHHRTGIVLILALFATPLYAQEPVNKWADGISWGTAFVNPTVATVDALKSNQKGCRLGRIVLSEAIFNAATITVKHFVVSPRPCVGCAPDGMWSGHSGNSVIGASSWKFGIVFAASTGALRMEANRHTPLQVAIGLLAGSGAELASHLVKCGS